MAIFDFWDSRQLTRFVKRNIEAQANANDGGENRQFFGQNIAPLVPETSREVTIRIADVLPYGLGQFKAPDASPPLWKTKPVLKEQTIELFLLEEMERFKSTEWEKLTTTDDRLSEKALLSLGDRLRIMQLRNERLTEWMRWQAFKGAVSVTFPDGGTITVDYGFTGSHLPTAATPWTDTVASDPVEDLYAWSQVGADDAGRYYSKVHLNSMTWRLLTRNQNVRGYLSALGRQIMLPTTADFQQLMREGTGNFELIDAGYLPENATNRRLTKFIPDNRVLLTTEYNLDGEPIADVADGPVAVNLPGQEEPVFRNGPQSEVISNKYTKNVFRRQASARVVRVYFPEAFLYAVVGA